jgi:hypothetical protein
MMIDAIRVKKYERQNARTRSENKSRYDAREQNETRTRRDREQSETNH